MSMNEPPRADLSQSRPPTYPPAHPWHYLPRGGNRLPLAAHEIAPSPCPGFSGRDLPKHEPAREYRIRELLAIEEGELAQSIDRYNDIVARGADALSRYDREICHGGDLELPRASSLALTHCHIAYHKSRVAWLRAEGALQTHN